MKSGKKKIIFSSICLVAAIAFAIFTVYAWFTTNEVVRSSGISANIVSGDVLKVEITYYNTIAQDSDDKTVTGYEVGAMVTRHKFDVDDENEEARQEVIMPDYTPSIGGLKTETTAVLMDMKITFAKPGTFYLKAKTTHSNIYSDNFYSYFKNEDYKKAYDEYVLKNYLSNVISWHSPTTDFHTVLDANDKEILTGTFTVNNDIKSDYSFINKQEDNAGNFSYTYFNGSMENNDIYTIDKGKKVDNNTVEFSDIEVTEGDKVVEDNDKTTYVKHVYYVMDYIPDQITSLYSLMLAIFYGKVTSFDTSAHIRFYQDMIFEIGDSQKEE